MPETGQASAVAPGIMTVELNASAGDGNRELAKASAVVTGPSEHVLIMMDKYQSGQITETVSGTERRSQINPYHYERAAVLIKALRGEELPVDPQVLSAAIAESIKNPFGRSQPPRREEAEGTGLEQLGSALEQLSEQVGDVSITVDSPVVDDRRDFIATITRNGKEVFKGSIGDALNDIGDVVDDVADGASLDMPSEASGTSREASVDDADGGETVVPNGPDINKRWLTRFRATANGEDDSIANTGSVSQDQIKSGLFVISALDANVAAILNAVIAFQFKIER